MIRDDGRTEEYSGQPLLGRDGGANPGDPRPDPFASFGGVAPTRPVQGKNFGEDDQHDCGR